MTAIFFIHFEISDDAKYLFDSREVKRQKKCGGDA